MIKLFTFFIAFNLSSLNFVQAESVGVSYIQNPELSQAEASVWKISSDRVRGTGFFIKPNLFVTNFHVIDGLLKTPVQARELKDTNFHVLFSLLQTENLNEFYLSQKGNPNTLHIKQVVAVSALYDLALLETKKSAPYYLTLSESEVKNNDELFSIGYPSRVFTKINKTGNINYENSQSFSFPVDHSELHGASGSPFLNKQEQVVGVLFQGSKNLINVIKVNHLKNLITGNIGQTCKNMILQNCLEKDIENLKNLAEQGNPIAQYRLAWMYENGRGVKQDLTEAFHWMEKAAEQGLAPAQYELAWMYQNGEGVEQNYELAFYWANQSAEQGHTLAQHNLAGMYLHGEGVEKNLELAFYWTQQSAEQGFAPAKYALALISPRSF